MTDDILKKQRAAFADFGLFAFKCKNIDELLTRASELVSEALEVDLVKVLEHRPERSDLLLRAGVNWEPGVVGKVTFADHKHSPAGFALLTDEPVVSRDVSTEDRFEIPDVLVRHGVKSMINVIIVGEDTPFGVLEVDARETHDFTVDDIAFMRTYANLLATAIARMRRHMELERSVREQSILARELGHRVANVLGLVQALASQTAVDGRTAREFRDEFRGRLQALAKAEGAVLDQQGGKADLQRLAEDILAPYRGERPEAIHVEGSLVQLQARAGRMLGLALHELATNAAKYGALSVPGGQARLEWQVTLTEERTLHVVWKEVNGPRVTEPKRQGFGSRLLDKIVSAELNGEADIDFRPEGLVYKFSFPLS